MSIPLVTRDATEKEIEMLRLYMSTFTDGSGYERNFDGTTRPGWRDLERVIAELLAGHAPEGKSIFDILVNAEKNHGISLKSKGFSGLRSFNRLTTDGRVYMELCNSPAKLWGPLKTKKITETMFENMENPNEIGNSILETVHSWYQNSGIDNLDLENSVHITVSYLNRRGEKPTYQLHTFPLRFPEGIKWKFNTPRCLRGYDPAYPEETLFDWYGLSGGQLKYYPRASSALYSTPQFKLEELSKQSIAEKAQLLWPDHPIFNP